MKSSRNGKDARRYAAKILFQYLVVKNGKKNKRRVCEERIINIYCDKKRLLGLVNRYGRDEQFDYKNLSGNVVKFQYIGIIEIIELFQEKQGSHCDGIEDIEEAWWQICEKYEPMERKNLILMNRRDLSVFRKTSPQKPCRGLV